MAGFSIKGFFPTSSLKILNHETNRTIIVAHSSIAGTLSASLERI
jgi:hypothetical protein